MAYFNAPSITSDGDMKKIYSYLQMLNQQLQYCFSSINPEDNFSLDSLVKYSETDTKIGQLEVSMDHFIAEFREKNKEIESSIRVMNDNISLKVSAEELCSEISLSTDTIEFKTGQLIVNTDNWKLNADGTSEFSGAIRGGSININDKFIVNENGGATVASSTFTKDIHCNGILYTQYLKIGGDAVFDGLLSCDKMTVSGTVSCEELYETSDRRLKEEIQTIPDEIALQAVLGLRPVVFRYKSSRERSMGYIAQEVEAMQQEKGLNLPMTGRIGEYLAIPYSSYGALYAGAIRAQQKEIEKLDKRIGEGK